MKRYLSQSNQRSGWIKTETKKIRPVLQKSNEAPEQKKEVKDFIEKDCQDVGMPCRTGCPRAASILSEIHTDSAKAYIFSDAGGVNIKSKPMLGIQDRLAKWLPWVQKFVFNAKSWIRGTHHWVNAEYFKLYLAEYTYRFNSSRLLPSLHTSIHGGNRRHDLEHFFSRALFACSQSQPYSTG